MKAIYAGSFDPFTNGHLNIVMQASELFDFVYVIISDNSQKKTRLFDINKMMHTINSTLSSRNIKNVLCRTTNKLIADLAKDLGCDYLIRGLRNPNDYNYEENIAKINKELNSSLKTIYFRSENEIVSSSFVRELIKYNKSISNYVPTEVNLIEENKGEV